MSEISKTSIQSGTQSIQAYNISGQIASASPVASLMRLTTKGIQAGATRYLNLRTIQIGIYVKSLLIDYTGNETTQIFDFSVTDTTGASFNRLFKLAPNTAIQSPFLISHNDTLKIVNNGLGVITSLILIGERAYPEVDAILENSATFVVLG